MLARTTPTVSVWFTLYLAEVFIRSCRCARRNFRENSMKLIMSYCPWFTFKMLVRTTPPTISVRLTLYLAEVSIWSCRCSRCMCKSQIMWKFHQELLSYCPWFDLIMLVRTTPPTISVRFILYLAEVFIRRWRCARCKFRENSIKN